MFEAISYAVNLCVKVEVWPRVPVSENFLKLAFTACKVEIKNTESL